MVTAMSAYEGFCYLLNLPLKTMRTINVKFAVMPSPARTMRMNASDSASEWQSITSVLFAVPLITTELWMSIVLLIPGRITVLRSSPLAAISFGWFNLSALRHISSCKGICTRCGRSRLYQSWIFRQFSSAGISDKPSEFVAGDNDKHDVQVGQNSKQSRGKNDCSRALI